MLKKSGLVGLFIAFGNSGCSYVDVFRMPGVDAGDRKIERLLKSELLSADSVEAAPLRVKVIGDVIVLEGVVEDSNERETAESIAEKLYPRFQIRNDIVVR